MSVDVQRFRPLSECPRCGSLLHSADTPSGRLACSSARCGGVFDAYEVVADV